LRRVGSHGSSDAARVERLRSLPIYRDALTVTDALGCVFTQFGERIEVLAGLSGPAVSEG
jgi:hypothetical protein